jgi:hypothetical protein
MAGTVAGTRRAFRLFFAHLSVLRAILAVLVAVAVTVAAAGACFAQATPRPGRKPTDTKPTRTTAQTAIGTVKSVAVDSIVVAGKVKGQNTEWTFAVDPTTKVRKASQDVTAAQLAPGDPVRVRYVEHEGRTVAQHIAVTTPVKPVKGKPEAAPSHKR